MPALQKKKIKGNPQARNVTQSYFQIFRIFHVYIRFVTFVVNNQGSATDMSHI